MNIHPIMAGLFKLDGGAMHGVVPKSLWSKKNPADENNMCSWALRCMLIEDGDRLILIDTGMGSKQDDKFFGYYYIHGGYELELELNKIGFKPEDITDVFLTHLHFDHCGGAIRRNQNGILEPAFKNAKYWSNKDHWKWATEPNPREKASFLKENIMPIEESGQLNFCSASNSPFSNWEVIEVNGHTEAQMIPVITYQDQKIAFCADLLPSVAHIPLPWTMAYDVRPLLSMQEKDKFLQRAAKEDWYLFMEHDYTNELAQVEATDRGSRLKSTFKFSEVFGN